MPQKILSNSLARPGILMTSRELCRGLHSCPMGNMRGREWAIRNFNYLSLSTSHYGTIFISCGNEVLPVPKMRPNRFYADDFCKIIAEVSAFFVSAQRENVYVI